MVVHILVNRWSSPCAIRHFASAEQVLIFGAILQSRLLLVRLRLDWPELNHIRMEQSCRVGSQEGSIERAKAAPWTAQCHHIILILSVVLRLVVQYALAYEFVFLDALELLW